MSRFRKAVRHSKKLKTGILGPAGSGKTYSGLLIARGVVGPTGRIALLDLENKSADLYADLTEFDLDTLEAPFSPESVIEGINDAVAEGYDIVIIDSITPVWEYLLERHEEISRRSGNSFTAWNKLTPMYNDFVQAILKAPIHVIFTIRAKVKYDVTSEEGSGKMRLKRLGIGPMFRTGIDYEPDLFLEMVNTGTANIATVTKSRIAVYPINTEFTPTPKDGEALVAWLNSGAAPVGEPAAPVTNRGPPADTTIAVRDAGDEGGTDDLW